MIQCSSEALCFVSSFVLADSFVRKIRHLRVAANRYKDKKDIEDETPEHVYRILEEREKHSDKTLGQ